MKIFKNSTLLMIGIIVSNLLSYLFHFIVGRKLGPEGYGEFGSLVAVLLLLALPSGSLGFAIAKFSARFNAQNESGTIRFFRSELQKVILVFSLILFSTICLLSKTISDYLQIKDSISVVIVGISIVFALLLPVNRGVLLGLKKYSLFNLNTIFESVFRLLFLLFFFYTGMGLNGAILAYGLAYLIAYILALPYLTQTSEIESFHKRIEWKPFYFFLFRVFILNFLIQSAINIPTIFIKHYSTDEFAGFWTAALNISRISLYISGAISLVMFPEISGEGNKQKQQKIYSNAAGYAFILLTALAFLFYLFGEYFIEILYGTAFSEAVGILQWMGMAMIPIGLIQLWVDYSLAKLK